MIVIVTKNPDHVTQILERMKFDRILRCNSYSGGPEVVVGSRESRFDSTRIP